MFTKRSWRSQPENHGAQRYPESEAVPRMLCLTATTGSVQLQCQPHYLIPFHSAVWGTHHLPADFIREMPLIGNLSTQYIRHLGLGQRGANQPGQGEACPGAHLFPFSYMHMPNLLEPLSWHRRIIRRYRGSKTCRGQGMPGKDIVHTKMGMFLVRLRDRRNHCDASPSKSHPNSSASAAPPNQVCPFPQEVSRATLKLPLGSPRDQRQILPTKQLLAKMVPRPQVPQWPCPHPPSTAAMYSWRWDRHHLSRTKPEQWYGVWTAPSEPLPVPRCTHTHWGSRCLLGELCHLRPVQLPALSQLCGEGGQHDVLQQHRGAVPPSLQVLKGIRPKNRLEKSKEGALGPCQTLNHAHFYWNLR